MIRSLLQIAAGTFGVRPIGARCVAPPLQRIVERDGRGGRDEHGGARYEFVHRNAGKITGLQRPFCDGDVTSRLDEPFELGVGDRRAVHPEPVDFDQVHGQGVGHAAVLASHPEPTPGNPGHAVGCEARRRRRVDARRRRGGRAWRGRRRSCVMLCLPVGLGVARGGQRQDNDERDRSDSGVGHGFVSYIARSGDVATGNAPMLPDQRVTARGTGRPQNSAIYFHAR